MMNASKTLLLVLALLGLAAVAPAQIAITDTSPCFAVSHGGPTPSFSITIYRGNSPLAGSIEIAGLAQVPLFSNDYRGMSPGGAAGATAPGATVFTSTASGSMGAASDLLYELGGPGVTTSTIGGGLDSIVFTPLSGSGYSWTAN